MDQTHDLLRALLVTSGRIAFDPADVYDLVNPTGKGSKQIQAYNLADGTRTQREVAKKAKIDAANFSHTVARWIAAGIMFRLGEGRDATLLHIYPIFPKAPKRT